MSTARINTKTKKFNTKIITLKEPQQFSINNTLNSLSH